MVLKQPKHGQQGSSLHQALAPPAQLHINGLLQSAIDRVEGDQRPAPSASGPRRRSNGALSGHLQSLNRVIPASKGPPTTMLSQGIVAQPTFGDTKITVERNGRATVISGGPNEVLLQLVRAILSNDVSQDNTSPREPTEGHSTSLDSAHSKEATFDQSMNPIATKKKPRFAELERLETLQTRHEGACLDCRGTKRRCKASHRRPASDNPQTLSPHTPQLIEHSSSNAKAGVTAPVAEHGAKKRRNSLLSPGSPPPTGKRSRQSLMENVKQNLFQNLDPFGMQSRDHGFQDSGQFSSRQSPATGHSSIVTSPYSSHGPGNGHNYPKDHARRRSIGLRQSMISAHFKSQSSPYQAISPGHITPSGTGSMQASHHNQRSVSSEGNGISPGMLQPNLSQDWLSPGSARPASFIPHHAPVPNMFLPLDQLSMARNPSLNDPPSLSTAQDTPMEHFDPWSSGTVHPTAQGLVQPPGSSSNSFAPVDFTSGHLELQPQHSPWPKPDEDFDLFPFEDHSQK